MSDRTERLCQLATGGDATAASELITLHYERVYAFLRRLCGNDADAADLTQKTFAKVWAALPSFAARSAFNSWIHGIARNVYVDWRRKGNRLDAQTEDWWAACAAEGLSPFEDAAERETAGQLYALVEQLDEDTRQAVHVHYYQGLSLKETAEALGVPASTLKYRLKQAVDFLRTKTTEPRPLGK